jgi:hypothetical protein
MAAVKSVMFDPEPLMHQPLSPSLPHLRFLQSVALKLSLALLLCAMT